MVTLHTRSKFVEQQLNIDKYGRSLINQFADGLDMAIAEGRLKLHFNFDTNSFKKDNTRVINILFIEYLKIKKYKVYDEEITDFKVLIA